jgi:hypothetical protein
MAPAILVLVGLMASRGAGWEPYSVPVGVEARGAHIEARATYDPGDKIGLGAAGRRTSARASRPIPLG